MIVRRRWTARATTAILFSASAVPPRSGNCGTRRSRTTDHPERHRDRPGPGAATRPGTARPRPRPQARTLPTGPGRGTGGIPRRPRAQRHAARRADRPGREGRTGRAACRGRQPAPCRERAGGPGPYRGRAARSAAGQRSPPATKAVDTLQVQQEYWWTTSWQTLLQAQVATTATEDPDVQITVSWRTADGPTGSYPLHRF